MVALHRPTRTSEEGRLCNSFCCILDAMTALKRLTKAFKIRNLIIELILLVSVSLGYCKGPFPGEEGDPTNFKYFREAL